MKHLIYNKVPDVSIFEDIFLQMVPQNVLIILTSSTEIVLEAKADIADILMYISQPILSAASKR